MFEKGAPRREIDNSAIKNRRMTALVIQNRNKLAVSRPIEDRIATIDHRSTTSAAVEKMVFALHHNSGRLLVVKGVVQEYHSASTFTNLPGIKIMEGLHSKVVAAVGLPGMAEWGGKIKNTSPRYSGGH